MLKAPQGRQDYPEEEIETADKRPLLPINDRNNRIIMKNLFIGMGKMGNDWEEEVRLGILYNGRWSEKVVR